jgi:hypothetical protein
LAIIYSYLPFLDACHRQGGIQSPVWGLGSLEFPDAAALSDDVAERLTPSGSRGIYLTHRPPPVRARPWRGSGVADLLRDRYGVAEYCDFDLNDDAAVQLDLSEPLPQRWAGGAGTVLEGGTLEHIFDFPTALRNVHEMLGPSGTFVGLMPISAWDHGFVNFNRKLLNGLAAANGYEVLVEGFWFRGQLPLFGNRFLTVLTREGDQTHPRARLWVDRMLNRFAPAQALLLYCFRKHADEPFRSPLDVFGNWSIPAEEQPLRSRLAR